MKSTVGQTIWDVLGVGIGVWALIQNPLPSVDHRIIQAIALFVIASSLRRLWRRWRSKP